MPQEPGWQNRYIGNEEARGDPNLADSRPDLSAPQGSGQILQFQLRRRAPVQPPPAAMRGSNTDPLDDLAQYEEEDAHIDYRHRMLMNVIAVMVVSSLVGVGVWIADTITDMEKMQDCLMQGRQNCAPITLPEKSSGDAAISAGQPPSPHRP
jgi:hypothetical protein